MWRGGGSKTLNVFNVDRLLDLHCEELFSAAALSSKFSNFDIQAHSALNFNGNNVIEIKGKVSLYGRK